MVQKVFFSEHSLRYLEGLVAYNPITFGQYINLARPKNRAPRLFCNKTTAR